MKKALFPLVLILIPGIIQAYPSEKILDARISRVTVFQGAAQIVRTAETDLSSGQSLYMLKAVSPYIDPQSIQVKGYGNFTVLSVNHMVNYTTNLGETEEITALRKEIELLEQEIEEEVTAVGILREDESFLMSNKVVTGREQGLDAENLRSMYEFFSTKLEEIRKTTMRKERNLKKLREELTKLQQQLNQLHSVSELPSNEIHITVSSKAAVRGKFEISYIVQGASWYPSYDIRVNELDEPVSLVYKANVYQNTGVEWNKVRLSFSNASPNRPGNIPELDTWYLNFPEPRPVEYNDSRKKSMAVPSRARELEVMDFNMAEESLPPQMTINQGITGFSFNLESPYDVPSDGKEKIIEMQRLSLPASFSHQAVPKLDPSAFLIAKIHDWEQYDLLDGESNLYFENTYVGKSFLNLSMKDTLQISLGRDQGIIIEREKRKEYTGERFIGNNRVDTRSWIISVRNTKQENVEIKISDQVPVSANKEIEVNIEEHSGGMYNDLNGIVSWQVKLKPGESKQLILTYTVKYPKDKQLILEYDHAVYNSICFLKWQMVILSFTDPAYDSSLKIQ